MSRLRAYTSKRVPQVGDDVCTFVTEKGTRKPVDVAIIMDIKPLGACNIVKIQWIGFRSGIPTGVFGFINSNRLMKVVSR